MNYPLEHRIAIPVMGAIMVCLHFMHVFEAFESQTGFSEMSGWQRYLLFAKDQYFYYYKTILEEKYFDNGLNRVFFDNSTEYPNTINAAHRFHVVPEIFTSLLYLVYLNITTNYNNLCSVNGIEDVNWVGWISPFYFYLGIVWILSGLTIFTMFIYAIFLSKNRAGGYACMAYYFTLHDHATLVHSSPSARENFAFPFMLIQFFILSKEISKHRLDNDTVHVRKFSIISDMALLTTITIIYWQMSSIIFITQILVVYFLYEAGYLDKTLVKDYAVSQIFANIFAYVLTIKNTFFLTSLHFATAISLMLHITKMQMYSQPVHNRSTAFKLRRFIRNLAMFIFLSYITLNLLNRIFGEYQNMTLTHIYLAATRLHLLPVNLISFLYDTMIPYGPMQLETAKILFNVFCLKNICLFIIISLAKYLQQRREKNNQEEVGDTIERAKNYVIEDYMEENRIKMNDLSNPNTEKEIQSCLELLKDCNYDYVQYKKKKDKHFFNAKKEKSTFLSDIKKLKDQISEKERNRQQDESGSSKTLEKIDSKSPEENKPDVNDITDTRNQHSTDRTNPVFDYAEDDPAYAYNFGQFVMLGILQLFIERMKYVFVPFICVFAVTIPSKKWFSKNISIYYIIHFVLTICTLINPGINNITNQHTSKTETNKTELIDLLHWIRSITPDDAVFGGPIDIISAVQLVTARSIVNHPHIETPEMRERTKSIYALYSRRGSIEVHNDLSTMRLNYVIVSHELCFDKTPTGRRIVDYWDNIDVEHRGDPQLCQELFSNAFTSFLKVYENKKYIVVRIFSENLKDFSDIKLLPSKFRTTQMFNSSLH